MPGRIGKLFAVPFETRANYLPGLLSVRERTLADGELVVLLNVERVEAPLAFGYFDSYVHLTLLTMDGETVFCRASQAAWSGFWNEYRGQP